MYLFLSVRAYLCFIDTYTNIPVCIHRSEYIHLLACIHVPMVRDRDRQGVHLVVMLVQGKTVFQSPRDVMKPYMLCHTIYSNAFRLRRSTRVIWHDFCSHNSVCQWVRKREKASDTGYNLYYHHHSHNPPPQIANRDDSLPDWSSTFLCGHLFFFLTLLSASIPLFYFLIYDRTSIPVFDFLKTVRTSMTHFGDSNLYINSRLFCCIPFAGCAYL